jgi:hypothetical protein
MEGHSTAVSGSASVTRRLRIRLLLIAAAVHLLLAAAIFSAGRFHLMPAQFRATGLAAFAADSYVYEEEVINLSNVLKNQGFTAWVNWPTQLHVRLYSIPVALLTRGSGFSILAIEPLNLIYYLAIVALVFIIAEAVFDSWSGLVAAVIVAGWPSLLLHTTQLLRDPLLICLVLLLMTVLVRILKVDLRWAYGALLGIAVCLAIVGIRIVRLPMWDLLWVISALAAGLLTARSIVRRSIAPGNVIVAGLLFVALVVTPHFQNSFRNQTTTNQPRVIDPEEVQKLPLDEQIATRRDAFRLQIDKDKNVLPAESGSNIDSQVEFNSPRDIVRHLPRAALVGFLAPFPRMWRATGRQVGSGGRALSGFETVLTYVIEFLALLGLWRSRRDLVAWFLAAVVVLGTVTLGLVVTNIGALYRLRYPFWILLTVLGAGGAVWLYRRRVHNWSKLPEDPILVQRAGKSSH